MIKPTQRWALVKRSKKAETTASGIELVSNQSDALVLRAELIAVDESLTDGLKPGDIVYCYKPKCFSVEGEEELFFTEPENICGWIIK